MKAISLIQPWASLAALGLKEWETRSWYSNYRGLLAIHASKRAPSYAREFFEEAFYGFGPLTENPYESFDDLPRGAIIAVARLADVVPTEELCPPGRRGRLSERERMYGDFSPGRYAWLLADVVRLAAPVPCRGNFGLWDAPPELRDLSWSFARNGDG